MSEMSPPSPPESGQNKSLLLAMLGFAASAASTVFMDDGAFTVFAAPMGVVILLTCLYYAPELPRTGPGAWAFAVIQAIAIVMVVGWLLNSIVETDREGHSYVQIGAVIFFSVFSYWRRSVEKTGDGAD